MKGKIAFIAGAGLGYVLGTRDGRQRYEQIKAKAQDYWTDPKVRSKVDRAVDQATDVAGAAASKAGEAASQAAVQAKDKVRSAGSDTGGPEARP